MGEELKKYRSRLTKEGILKAVLCGLLVAFSVLLVSAAICYFTGFKAFWLPIALFGVAALAATPIFYFTMFRPTAKSIAKRLDTLGLEERMITMTEFANDNSYIAKRQREDAVASLSNINATLIKFAVSVPLIICLCVVGVAGAGMSTVHALSTMGVITPGDDIIGGLIDPPEEEVFYELTYVVEGDGMLIEEETGAETDEVFLLVSSFATAQKYGVTAVAMEGWVFVGWMEDESTEPYRKDLVTEDTVFTAVFMELEEGEGDGDGEGDGEGEPSDKPGESGSGEGGSEGESSPGEGGEEAGGNWSGGSHNNVNDGNTSFGDALTANGNGEGGEGFAGGYLGGLAGSGSGSGEGSGDGSGSGSGGGN